MSDDLPLHSVSVTGIVIRDEDQHVLVIKRRDDGWWVPPGGVLELDESPQEGVVREVLEETGVQVEPVKLVGVYKNMKRGVVSLAFRCRPVGGERRTSDESSRVEWCTLDEVTRDVVEARAIRVLDAFEDRGPYVRIHDGASLMPNALETLQYHDGQEK